MNWTLGQAIAFTYVAAGGKSEARVGLTPDRGRALGCLHQLLCGETIPGAVAAGH
jgi:hypothetical protein